MANLSLNLNGIILVNKPSGVISKDVSRLILKKFGNIKIGHVGTLDPLAQGVLPLLIGHTTRFQDYFLECPKEYKVQMELGYETDTLDLEGQIIAKKEWKHVCVEDVTKVLQSMIGERFHIPPLYSATKYKGRPLYEYAALGKQNQICLSNFQKKIKIFNIEIVTIDLPIIIFHIRCSKGTYVRSIVKEVGELLGTCATLTTLIRTNAAGYSIEECIDFAELNKDSLDLKDIIISQKDMRLPLGWIKLDDAKTIKKIIQGNYIIMKKDYFVNNVIYDNKLNINNNDKYVFIKNHVFDLIGVAEILELNHYNIKIIPKRMINIL